MSSGLTLVKRSAILGFSNIANKAILFLSPIILVRLLSVTEYGQYREFILYATTVVTVLTFGATRSLLYFLPQYPEKTKLYTTQALSFVFCSSLLGVAVLGIAGDQLRELTSFDFVPVLQLYIFFALNFDFLEMYWLARKQTAYVLYYSAARLVLRLAVASTAAALTGSAETVVWALTFFEGARMLLVAAFSVHWRMHSFAMTGESIRRQLYYFLPLGAGHVVLIINDSAGKFLVTLEAGAAALAVYVIGTFAMPIVNMVRGTVADVVFPEIMSRHEVPKRERLGLWRASTGVYCALLFPTAVTFALVAEEIVSLLFTAEYAASAPIFAVFAMLMIVYCFDFHLPLRVANQNKHFMVGNLLALATNMALIIPAYRAFGLVGPAAAFVVAQAVMTLFLARRAQQAFGLSLGELAPWPLVGRVALAAGASGGVLVYVNSAVAGVPGTMAGLAAFAATYLLATNLLGVWKREAIDSVLAAWRRRRARLAGPAPEGGSNVKPAESK